MDSSVRCSRDWLGRFAVTITLMPTRSISTGRRGVVATRKPQLRLTLPIGEGFYGQLAVEPAISGNEVPTFLAALRYSSGWGAVNVTGAVGQHEEGGQNVTAHTLHVGAHLNATDATRVMATLNMTRGDGQIYGGSGAISGDVCRRQPEGRGFDRRIRRGLPWLERQHAQRGVFRLGRER